MAQPAPSPGRVALQVAHKTDPGLDPDKQVNEDACAHREVPAGHLLVVCDGMGGHAAGREASQRAIETIFREMEATTPAPGPSLKRSIEVAGRAVYELGGPPHNRLRPGSTCVSLLVHPAGIEVAHVGDSRAYMLRAGQIYPITRDHSMVQQMVDAGVLTPQEAVGHPDANKITRALGMAPEVEVELRPSPIPHAPGDVLLLASDGLTDLVTPEDIAAAVVQALQVRGLAFACEQLVALANARGGHDNITVLMALVCEPQPAPYIARPTIPEAVAASAMGSVAMPPPPPPPAPMPAPSPLAVPPAPTPPAPPVQAHPPAATVPGMPTIPEGPPLAMNRVSSPRGGAGPAPTMVDESLAGDTGMPAPLQPGAVSGSWAQPTRSSARVPVLLIAGVALVLLGIVVGLAFFFWALTSSSNADTPPPLQSASAVPQPVPSASGSAPRARPSAR